MRIICGYLWYVLLKTYLMREQGCENEFIIQVTFTKTRFPDPNNIQTCMVLNRDVRIDKEKRPSSRSTKKRLPGPTRIHWSGSYSQDTMRIRMWACSLSSLWLFWWKKVGGLFHNVTLLSESFQERIQWPSKQHCLKWWPEFPSACGPSTFSHLAVCWIWPTQGFSFSHNTLAMSRNSQRPQLPAETRNASLLALCRTLLHPEKFLSTQDGIKHPEMHKKKWKWENFFGGEKNEKKKIGIKKKFSATDRQQDGQTNDITEWEAESLLASSKARLKTQLCALALSPPF